MPDALIRWIAGALAVLALLAGIWWHGHSRGAAGVQAEWDAAQSAADRAELVARNAAIVEALQIERRAVAAQQARATAREEKQRVITREVVRYVERENAVRTAGGDVPMLDADWVRIHDAAARPADGAAEPIPDEAAGPATAGAALDAVTGNYTQCYLWRDQVIGWQERWKMVRDQAAD